jgi:hypothetical protein
MPATSLKQKKFMDAAAHNPSFAQQAGIPQSVAKDFSGASKGMKFGKGSTSRPDLQRINKPETKQGKNELFKKGGDTMATKMNPGFMAMMAKKKGAFEKSGKDVEKKGVKEGSKADMAMDKKQMMKKGGATKKMASGGSASARADGVATKGKTQGKMLKKGGMAC